MLQALGLLILTGALWGCTNPFIKQGTRGLRKVRAETTLGQAWAEVVFLLGNWRYVVPFVINQLGSLSYLLAVQSAPLSLAVPAANSLAFAFTAVVGSFVGAEEPLDKGSILGIALIAGGTAVCCWDNTCRYIHGTKRTGNRDLVGHGINGSANYRDDAHFPFPAVRFRENTEDIMSLRKKEEGDWRSLTLSDKRALYRASFCQTFAEFQHPTGQWKVILGGSLLLTSLGFWIMMFYHEYVYPPLPTSLGQCSQRAQLRRMLDLHVNPIDGLSSLWDYDNDCWKSETTKKLAATPPEECSDPPSPPAPPAPPSSSDVIPCEGCGCGGVDCQCGE